MADKKPNDISKFVWALITTSIVVNLMFAGYIIGSVSSNHYLTDELSIYELLQGNEVAISTISAVQNLSTSYNQTDIMESGSESTIVIDKIDTKLNVWRVVTFMVSFVVIGSLSNISILWAMIGDGSLFLGFIITVLLGAVNLIWIKLIVDWIVAKGRT